MQTDNSLRLNKFISDSGMCSRREADRFIESGLVQVNGKKAKTGDRVFNGDQVKVNGQLIDPPEIEEFHLIALNKPVGVVSTTDPDEPDNIVDFVRHGARIFPIGRLDKDSEGLIFLTNKGDLVNKILRAGNNHEKEYLVGVDKPITDKFIEGMAGGVPILGQKTKKCKVSKESTYVFRITLVQGLNRQIRRMAEHFGYKVKQLQRVRIMNVALKGLPVGEWRDLTNKELETLLKSIEDSSGEATKGSSKKKPSSRRSSYKGNSQGGAKAGGSRGSHKSNGRGDGGRSSGNGGRNGGAEKSGGKTQGRKSNSRGGAAKRGGNTSTRSNGKAAGANRGRRR